MPRKSKPDGTLDLHRHLLCATFNGKEYHSDPLYYLILVVDHDFLSTRKPKSTAKQITHMNDLMGWKDQLVNLNDQRMLWNEVLIDP